MKVLYEGSEDQVLPIYDQIEAAIAATRAEKAGPSFEVYLDDPTQAGGSVKRHIYQIVKGDLTTLRALSSPGATMTPASWRRSNRSCLCCRRWCTSPGASDGGLGSGRPAGVLRRVPRTA